jgi:hypothetical protein
MQVHSRVSPEGAEELRGFLARVVAGADNEQAHISMCRTNGSPRGAEAMDTVMSSLPSDV